MAGCGVFSTYSQGGWGAKPAGKNPGAFLRDKFAEVFPAGFLVGGGYTLLFTSSQAIQDFLPAGGPPSVLTGSAVNPTTTSAGVFAAQVMAVKLSVSFSQHDKMPGETVGDAYTLSDVLVGDNPTRSELRPFAGMAIGELLHVAENVLGGLLSEHDLSVLFPQSAVTVPVLNNALESVIDFFHEGGTPDGVNFRCPSR